MGTIKHYIFNFYIFVIKKNLSIILVEIQSKNKDTHCVVCELSLFSNPTFAPVPQEKRRAERAEQQRVRAEKEKERQARREVCYFQTMKM